MTRHRRVRSRICTLLGAVVVAMGVGGPAAAQAEDPTFGPYALLSVDAPNQLPGGVAKLTADAWLFDVPSSPYRLKIYDVTDQKFLKDCKANTCVVNVTQSAATQHTYRAYIAGQATSFPPPSIQAASDDVVVSWGAKLVLNANFTELFEYETATLTAKAAVAGTIAIKDATMGQTIKICPATTVCSISVKQTMPTTHDYYAIQGALPANIVSITWMKMP